MKSYYKLLAFFTAFLSQPVFGQNSEVEMADTMRSNGKIYVVVAIILVIFAGMVIYLITMDRKVSRLEKKLPQKKA